MPCVVSDFGGLVIQRTHTVLFPRGCERGTERRGECREVGNEDE